MDERRMKNRNLYINKRWIYRCAGIIVAGLMILSGGLMEWHAWNIIKQTVYEGEDQALMAAAETADHSITFVMEQFADDLQYVVNRRGFQSAEQSWRDTGDVEDLTYRLGENLLTQDPYVDAMVAIVDGNVIASSGDEIYNVFQWTTNPIEGQENCLYRDADGNIYLTILLHKEDISYAAMIRSEAIYRMVEHNATISNKGDLLLADDQGIVRRVDENAAAHTMQSSEEDLKEDARVLLEGMASGESGCYDCAVYREDGSVDHWGRIAVIAAEDTHNQCFSIGIADYSEHVIISIKEEIPKMVLYGFHMLCGIVLLIFILAYYERSEKEKDQELQLLREKKQALEDMNEQMQELAHHQRLELLGQLTSGISHDFNNLLTPIMGHCVMVMEKISMEDTEVYDGLLEIYTASRKCKELISRLSDLSRKNSSQTMHWFSPDKIAEQTIAVTKPIQPENVQIESSCTCGERMLYGNEIQFSQMLLNLVMNALQAMEPEGGKLQIATSADEKYVIFSVKDTGKGIPEEIRSHIFEPFFTTKESSKGTGLGLAIVHQMVEEYKGTIEVFSEPGKGTTFVVTFPISGPATGQTTKR